MNQILIPILRVWSLLETRCEGSLLLPLLSVAPAGSQICVPGLAPLLLHSTIHVEAPHRTHTSAILHRLADEYLPFPSNPLLIEGFCDTL